MGRCLLSMQNLKAVGLCTGNCRKRSFCICWSTIGAGAFARRLWNFYDLHGRIPRGQNVETDEQRAEDALAQRWDRLLAQKASLPDELLNAYNRIFAAAEMEPDDTHLAVCIAASELFETARRLPKRQVVDSDEKRSEDALAQRWDRLLAEKASVSEDLRASYSAIFGAAEIKPDDTHLAVCIAVSEFFATARRLPKRQVVNLLCIIDTVTSLPSTYVWAFGFVGFILFSTGNHKLQPRAEKTEMKMKSKWRCF